jgi:hypothetical protein
MVCRGVLMTAIEGTAECPVQQSVYEHCWIERG